MNKLVTEAHELLKNGGFDYAICGGQALDMFLGYESRTHGDVDICAFRDERDRIIRYMQSLGFDVYEMLGGGKVHRITDLFLQNRQKNIFCARENCPLVKLYPTDETDVYWMEFFHTGETEPDYIEFLFNDRTQGAFEYARNREITLGVDRAVLFSDGIPYLAPELILLYKSTDIERDGYQQDFELAYRKMDASQKAWFRNAIRQEYPEGHQWLDAAEPAV